MGTRVCMLVALAGLILGCASQQDRLRQSLAEDIRPGDSAEQVRSIIGGEWVTDPARRQRLLRGHQTFAERFPKDYPDGVQSTDRFLRVSIDSGHWTILQFRDGRLINHDPAEFNDPDAMELYGSLGS